LPCLALPLPLPCVCSVLRPSPSLVFSLFHLPSPSLGFIQGTRAQPG
jgi:hypothetical protein